MATGITIELKARTEEFKREVKNALDQGSAQVRQFKSAIDSATSGFGSMRSVLSDLKRAFLGLGAALVLKEIAQAAVQSAINIDKTRQTIAALTGSVESANKKIAELRKLAASSPGVTTSFATDLFAQFKALRVVADTTINDLIKSIGRLNAVFQIPDIKTFSRNLIQIFQGGFEKDQIKEALQTVPIFEQLLQEAFGTSDGQKLKKLKDAGKLSMETFLRGIIEKIDERFKDVQDGIGSLFEKLKDRITVALEPLGQELTKILLPVFDDAVKKVEQYGESAARIFRENRNDIIAAAKEITAMTVEIGKLIGQIGQLAAKSQIFEFIGRAAAEAQDIINDPGNLFTTAKGPRLLAFEARLAEMQAERSAIANSPFLSSQIRDLGVTGDPRAVYNSATGRFELPPGIKSLTNNNTTTTGTSGGGGRGISDSQRASARERVDRFFSRESIAALERNTEARLNGANEATAELIKSYKIEIKAREKYVESLQKLGDATSSMVSRGFSNLIRNGAREFNDANRDSSRAYNLQLQSIDDLFNRGAINPGEVEALRRQAALQRASALDSNLNGPNAKFIDRDDIQNLRDEAEHMTRLGTAISDTERFMRGFNSSIISVGDAFDRFGQNVAQALTNTMDLLNGLKQAVLGFFNDLLGRSLQNLVGQALAPIAGLFGQGGQLSFAGAAGNLFRTPPTFSQSAFVGIANDFFQSPITSPSSVSSGGTLTLDSILRGVGGGGGSGIPIPTGGGGGASSAVHEAAHAASGIGSTASRFSFGALGKSIGQAAPFLGLSLGGALGGQSVAGQILGSAAGALGGLVLGASTGAIKGGLGAAFKLSGALGPIGLAVGAGLLVGSYFLGKAKQRRQDEELSGQYLTQALQAIDQLAAGVSSGSIPGSEARAIFESNILGTFRQQISGLKTKSVVESRLTNQVRDLRNVFDARIQPLIAEQERKASDARRFAAIDSRLIPQFAGGGYVGGIDRGFDSVSALLRPGELVLNRGQQAAVIAQSSPSVFRNAGVPAVNTSGRFESGGYAQPSFAPSRGAQSDTPIVIYLDAVVDAEGIFIRGGMTESGRQVIVKQNDATNLKKRHR